ncbi:MAG: magnesium/cobalt transporter CorA [Nocardioidaceae bacterium]
MIVDCAVYEHGKRREGELRVEHACLAGRRPGAFTWIGLYEPSENEFDSIRREFDLHELAVEDAVHAHQRPKLEVYGDMIFLVLKTARYVDPEEVVELGEILIFLGADYIITARHGEASALQDVRNELEHNPQALRRGPGAALHAILDRVVDDYQPALDGLTNDIEEVEQEVFSERRSNPAERIYKLKREVLEFHRAVVPLVDPVDRLARGQYELVDPQVRTYFRDVNDHLLRAREQLDALRDLLTSVLTANLTQVSVRQNDDVRKISAWAAIVAVPTMIAGIYGMNFEHMPELDWSFGYPLALACMLVICTLLYRNFKRVGWL